MIRMGTPVSTPDTNDSCDRLLTLVHDIEVDLRVLGFLRLGSACVVRQLPDHAHALLVKYALGRFAELIGAAHRIHREQTDAPAPKLHSISVTILAEHLRTEVRIAILCIAEAQIGDAN